MARTSKLSCYKCWSSVCHSSITHYSVRIADGSSKERVLGVVKRTDREHIMGRTSRMLCLSVTYWTLCLHSGAYYMQQHSQIGHFKQVQGSSVILTISLLIWWGNSGLEVINRLITSKNGILGGSHFLKPNVTCLKHKTVTTPDIKSARWFTIT